MEEAKNLSLQELISSNYVVASALYYFGIKFYQHPTDTKLADLCEEYGLSLNNFKLQVELESKLRHTAKLNNVPVDLLIGYLKHTHRYFIRHRLPFMANLVAEAKEEDFPSVGIAEDIKFVFPMFVEEFIHHIHEEEDTLFTYINTLSKSEQSITSPGKLFYMLEHHSIHQYALEHEQEDDEMEGIRQLTNDYYLPQDASLTLKVAYQELQRFEDELTRHAYLENTILFPKALELENRVVKKLSTIALDN